MTERDLNAEPKMVRRSYRMREDLSGRPIGEVIQMFMDEVSDFQEKYSELQDITFDIDVWADQDDAAWEFELNGRSPETEEETRNRLNREERQRDYERDRKRRMYEELKKEFEGADG